MIEAKKNAPIKCAIIGIGTLPVQCAIVLKNLGHEIAYIISSDQSVRDWALDHDIPHGTETSDIHGLFAPIPVDYLFSIVNPVILDEKTLKVPNRVAINFHDGPLPKYAGSHVTSWAIINNEKRHAVTWHEMAPKVDAGSIYVQEWIEVDPDETALSLNLKCYETAIKSFNRLIDKIVNEDLGHNEQKVTERSFYSRSKRPHAGAVLDWRRPAHQLDSTVRALTFGSYSNPLVLPKIYDGRNFLVVGESAVQSGTSVCSPGEITDIGNDYLQVATAAGEIKISQLARISGEPVDRLLESSDWQIGDKLPLLDAGQIAELNLYSAKAGKDEPGWIKRLRSVQPNQIPSFFKLAGNQEYTGESTHLVPIKAPVAGLDIDLYSFWIAAFATYLGRVSEQSSVHIGLIDLERPRPSKWLEEIYEFNTPLVIEIAEEANTTDLVDQIANEIERNRKDEFYAKDLIARYPNLQNVDSHFPLQVCIGSDNWRKAVDEINGDLILVVTGDGQAFMNYNPQKLSIESVESAAEQIALVYSQMISKPELPLWSHELLTTDDKHKVFFEWNSGSADFDYITCVHKLFENIADQSPELLAVSFEGRSITYGELEEKSNQLAQLLKQAGLTQGEIAGIGMSRSLELIIGLLGIMKAGGAYLPLDPDFPQDRLNFLIKDSGARLIISQKSIASKYQTVNGKVICLDDPELNLQEQPSSRVYHQYEPDSLAYVIHTSGSTGEPKGAMNRHQGICNQLLSFRETFSITSSDVFIHKTPYSFDVSLIEVFLPLISGASLVIAKPGGHLDAGYIGDLIAKHGVTVASFVPVTLTEILKSVPVSNLISLRCVTTGGESLSMELISQFYDRTESAGLSTLLYNCYGPSEAAVTTTIWKCDRKGIDGLIPIGRTFPNNRVYILDRNRMPVPIGVPGELYIGGPQVGLGYWLREELTKYHFVADMFQGGDNGRLYKTGDKVRYLSDGNILFLGRYDRQLKLNGLRIEPGEIEALLENLEYVESSVVDIKQISTGEFKLVVYVKSKKEDIDPIILRNYLNTRLPKHMVPSAYVILKSFPLLSNGKIDISGLPEPKFDREDLTTPYIAPETGIDLLVSKMLSKLIGVKNVGVEDNFFDIGATSLVLIAAFQKLQELFPDSNLTVLDLFENPTVKSLTTRLGRNATVMQSSDQKQVAKRRQDFDTDSLAIIGIDGRFPQADNLDDFWKLVVQGKEAVSEFSDQELLQAGVTEKKFTKADYVRRSGIVEGYDYFDEAFFGYTPKEASLIDPQQRILLEIAWHTLENAGYDPFRYDGKIGVFAGMGRAEYLRQNLYANPQIIETMGEWQTAISNESDYLASRVSYKLNLFGPSINIQTACSTSLVALHMACQSLAVGDCEMALAGGIRLLLGKKGYTYQPGAILSPDGHCRPFDADASGTIPGSGAGVVLLKRLTDAIKDGDYIHAIIRGSAVNNDGARKVGYTAPSPQQQASVISDAIQNAEIDGSQIGYIEAHGTGTTIGDPIEILGLTRALDDGSLAKPICAIGSVKANIGHADAAAGIAGLLKIILAFKNDTIPPIANFNKLNPEIKIENGQFYFPEQPVPWARSSSRPRIAGVSSFGVGGTNVHVILQEPPVSRMSEPESPWQLLVLSAKSSQDLSNQVLNLKSYLSGDHNFDLSDIAYTLQVGRTEHEYRAALVCQSQTEAVQGLEKKSKPALGSAQAANAIPKVIFLFPGQGTQHVNMGYELYQCATVFRNELNRCAELLEPKLGFDICKKLYPSSPELQKQLQSELNETGLTQPILFSIEYATARQWQAWGIKPDAMFGHSLGEFVAACLSGVLTLEEAVEAIHERGRLMQQLQGGSMVAVNLNEEKVKRLMDEELSVAATNSPEQTVISGPDKNIQQLIASLSNAGIEHKLLRTSHAFHSKTMDLMRGNFQETMQGFALKSPKIPYVSCVTGTWITTDMVTDIGYWFDQLRQGVRFVEGIKTLESMDNAVFIEMGPGNVLSTLTRINLSNQQKPMILQSMGGYNDQRTDMEIALKSIGQMWLQGFTINWESLHNDQLKFRVPLPGYPFNRSRHWISAPIAPIANNDEPHYQKAVDSADKQQPENKTQLTKTASPIPVVLSDSEQFVIDVWKELMGLDAIDTEDNFFDLGGHSLLATRFLSIVKNRFGVELSHRIIFDYPTVYSLAAEIDQKLS